MSRPHHQSKLSNPSLLSMQEKLSFYNLLLTSPNKVLLFISFLSNPNPLYKKSLRNSQI